MGRGLPPIIPRKHRCGHCAWSFDRLCDMRRHSDIHEPAARKYKCPWAGIKTTDKCKNSPLHTQQHNMITHILSLHMQYRWSCHVCGVQFNDPATLSRHCRDTEHKGRQSDLDVAALEDVLRERARLWRRGVISLHSMGRWPQDGSLPDELPEWKRFQKKMSREIAAEVEETSWGSSSTSNSSDTADTAGSVSRDSVSMIVPSMQAPSPMFTAPYPSPIPGEIPYHDHAQTQVDMSFDPSRWPQDVLNAPPSHQLSTTSALYFQQIAWANSLEYAASLQAANVATMGSGSQTLHAPTGRSDAFLGQPDRTFEQIMASTADADAIWRSFGVDADAPNNSYRNGYSGAPPIQEPSLAFSPTVCSTIGSPYGFTPSALSPAPSACTEFFNWSCATVEPSQLRLKEIKEESPRT